MIIIVIVIVILIVIVIVVVVVIVVDYCLARILSEQFCLSISRSSHFHRLCCMCSEPQQPERTGIRLHLTRKDLGTKLTSLRIPRAQRHPRAVQLCMILVENIPG